MPAPFTTPVAQSVPFLPDRDPQYNGNAGPSGISSTNVQDAIEEVKGDVASVARFVAMCGFDGTASVGRYLEFSGNVDSNQAGFVMARAGVLKELSIASNTNSTVTVTIRRWTPTPTFDYTTITLSASRKNQVTGLNINFNAGDEIAAVVTSGSASRPVLCMFIVFT